MVGQLKAVCCHNNSSNNNRESSGFIIPQHRGSTTNEAVSFDERVKNTVFHRQGCILVQGVSVWLVVVVITTTMKFRIRFEEELT